MTYPLVIDFETKPIGRRPHDFPPEPVGMAWSDGSASGYFAWGHPTGNNCMMLDAMQWLWRERDRHAQFICHNYAFDYTVAGERLGVDIGLHHPPEDTLALAFFDNPYAPDLGLKPLAEKLLGEPPTERDDLRDWLIAHQPVPGARITKTNWGAYIAWAPGDVVAPYAIGDCTRTMGLWKLLRPRIEAHGMLPAYRREMRALVQTIRAERRGVPVDADRICEDGLIFERALSDCEGRIRRALGMTDSQSIDSNADMADAIERTFGIALPLTTKGNRQTNKKALEAAITDGAVLADLRYHGALSYDLSTYMGPMVEAAQHCGGTVHPQWNPFRQTDDWGRGGGARSGRYSSSPNFQNLRDAENEALLLTWLRQRNPAVDYRLPQIRSYIVAPRGMVVYGRDWSQIELRMTAHYEDGPIAAHYRDDPRWDLHQFVIDSVREMFGVTLPRRIAKNIGFGIIYGAGGRAIAEQAGIPYDEAMQLRNMYLAVNPSIRELMYAVQERGRLGGFITTLGGRRYFAEPPRWVDGELRSFEYKLLNYLIQPSAADLMKEAIGDWGDSPSGDDFAMTVHDELVGVCPVEELPAHMETLRVAMDENTLVRAMDVPVFSAGYFGPDWANVEDYNDAA